MRVLRARHRGRARRRRGCQRLLAGRGGAARSTVAVSVARRRVCLETRWKQELMGSVWPPGVPPRILCTITTFLICNMKFKRYLFLPELRSLSTYFVELANEGHGEHRASREAGGEDNCGREGGKLYQDRIGGKVVARWASGVRGWEGSSAVQFISFLTGARCSNQAENYYMRGDGDVFFFPRFFAFIRIFKRSLYFWTNTSQITAPKKTKPREKVKNRQINNKGKAKPPSKKSEKLINKKSKGQWKIIKTQRDIREKRITTMEKAQKWGKHRRFFENEHACGALRTYVLLNNSYGYSQESSSYFWANTSRMTQIPKKKKTEIKHSESAIIQQKT